LSLSSNGAFTYTPNAGYVGSDSFTYVATDGSNTTNTATVTLSVYAPGTVTGDYLANNTAQGTTVAFGDAAVSPQTGLATVNVGLGGDAPDLELVYTPDVTVKPIIQTTFASDSSLSVPTQLSVTLIWNGTTESPVTFSTTGHAAGDTYGLDVQVPSAVSSTGLYAWETEVTATYSGGIEATIATSGSAAVVVSGYGGGASPFGVGWSLLPAADQLVSVSGGVLWVDGQGGVQYFTGPDSSGNFTSPADDFGSLVLNTDGSYTYTAHDDTHENFDSSGRVKSIVDTNSLAQTFTYGTHGLSSITEINGVVETLSYDTNGYVQTITEPGGEVVTLAHDSGGNLTSLDSHRSLGS
jgi:YD repeat-containing protein